MVPVASLFSSSLRQQQQQHRTMVHLHGPTVLSSNRGRQTSKTQRSSVVQAASRLLTPIEEPPPNPDTLLTQEELQERTEMLLEWWEGKKNVLCITGAGLSTESGLTDYRGHNGSYHRGHKPMIHDQFMKSEYQRKRYWGRGMVGWRHFDSAKPNVGHYALASLERLNRLGVQFEDKAEYHAQGEDSERWLFGSGQQTLSIITQNVDSLHRRAGSKHVTELHGRTDLLQCMSCGTKRGRLDFHDELESRNEVWLKHALKEAEIRPDGDAALSDENYNLLDIPSCKVCGEGFLKPSVVFFGDNVPKHRVERCTAAVDAADGLLVVGSSLAVYSAYRHVRAAHQKGTPIAILNVGETRAELEGLEVTKIEAPAGPTLSLVASYFEGMKCNS
ncbi:silent information regulator protein Sir2 [Nitzschia inconspicua]|uniref:Silent information regulator protein Sir2 n=1 Tax=Nitzschia inconspicua TaxID=303405 RepID=A0A9K3LNQ7_9STRA|nr:silent information regulator protein Sir2 [Nitzschia inconspicua]